MTIAKPRRKPVQREKALQSEVCRFLKMALPHDATYLVLPGGAGSRTKAPGYVRGTPDILVVHQGRACFIEMKSAKGTVSDDQRIVIGQLQACGCRVSLARSIDDVAGFLLDTGIPLRARVTAGAWMRAA